jgi:hypothetical protein
MFKGAEAAQKDFFMWDLPVAADTIQNPVAS